jgi:hypothetical protein
MAQRVKVSCIKKTNRPNHWERISHIGGQYADGTRWQLTEEQAIAGIKSKALEYFVEVPGYASVDVIIAEGGPNRREYLKTKADSETSNNLLSLPECP